MTREVSGDDRARHNNSVRETESWRFKDADYLSKLHGITEGKTDAIVSALKSATDPRLRHPLQIVGYTGTDHSRVDTLPVDAASYEDATYRIGSTPLLPEGSTYTSVTFGYNLYDEFRRIGAARFLNLDSEGKVQEIGFGSEVAMQYFRHHLLGRDLSPHDRKRIKEVQAEVFQYLRNDPGSAESLREFSKSRGWPQGLEDVAGLAYFHDRVTPLREVARSIGFSDEEMYLAGWYELNFTSGGQPSYSVRDSHVIRIPYFNKDGETEVWRTRNLRPSRATSHKYTSWPLDRSINRQFTVEEKLYYGWDLDKAKGRTVVITEGEFKCLVASQMTGVFTVGIPGITEVDDGMIKALVESGANEYIVVLDRDPRGKGLMRVDGITDSERAAYAIAKQLQKAGAGRVGVGRIPDVSQGKKVGIDDLILAHGAMPFYSLMDHALTPERYAKATNLNETFFEIWETRQQVRKALEYYDYSVRRGGSTVDPELYNTATRIRDEVENLYADFLLNRFRGAFRIDQPTTEHSVLYRFSPVPKSERKFAMVENGKGIPLEKFCNDIIYFQYFPDDIPSNLIWVGTNNLKIPFSIADIQEFFEKGETNVHALSEVANRGLKVLKRMPEDGQPYIFGSLNELATTVLAGYLSNQFPDDEYNYSTDLILSINRDAYWEEDARIPLAIFRQSSGEAVAFASVVAWEQGVDKNAAVAMNRRTFNQAVAFLRRRDSFFREDRQDMVTKTIWPYWFERKLDETVNIMSAFGVSEDMAKRYLLMTLDPKDQPELIDHFIVRKLLNAAAQSGIFRWDEQGMVIPRFRDTSIIMPVLDEARQIIGLRVLPLNLNDHLPPTLDPNLRLVRYLDGGGQHLMEAFDPERQLYMQDRLANVKGKTLIITYHELDGLILGSSRENVVALNSSFKLHPEVIAKIAQSEPVEITMVISGTVPKSPYDHFAFDGIPVFMKELYDLQQQVNNALPEGTKPIPIKVTLLSTPLTRLGEEDGLSNEQIDTIAGSAVDVTSYLSSRRFNPQQHEILRRLVMTTERLMDYLEVLALPDLLDGKPLEWWINESRRLHKTVQSYAKQNGNDVISLEGYFQRKLNLDEPVDLSELVRQRKEERVAFFHRPVYLSKNNDQAAIAGNYEDFRRFFNSTILQEGGLSTDMDNILQKAQKGRAVTVPVQYVKPEFTVANPKGSILELSQKAPDRFVRPDSTFEEVDGGFRYTVKIVVQPEGIELTASGTASRKKDAEAFAYEGILLQISEQNIPLEQQKTIDETTTIDNPKGRVFDILQKNNPSFIRPEAAFTQTPIGFIASVTVVLEGKSFSATGTGKTKKDAEAAAFAVILPGIEKPKVEEKEVFITPQVVTAPTPKVDSELRGKIEKALRMPPGDHNYVGRTYYVAQMTRSKTPEFSGHKVITDQGPMWIIQASMTLNHTILVSDEFQIESKQEGRQQAALSLLSKIHAYAQQ